MAIGATVVGSINWTVEAGQEVQKGDELGYFAFGGEPGRRGAGGALRRWDSVLAWCGGNHRAVGIAMRRARNFL